MLLKQMRRTVPENDFFGGGPAEKTWRELRDQELSREMSRRSSLGIAEMVFNQLAGGKRRMVTQYTEPTVQPPLSQKVNYSA